MGLSDGIKVLIITAVCYLLTYSYESAYFRYYDLPFELINIDIKNILFFGVTFMGVFFVCLLPLANLVSKIIDERKKENKKTSINFVYISYGVLVLFFIIDSLVFYQKISIFSIVLYVMFFLVLAANDILIPMMFDKERPLSERINENMEEQRRTDVLITISKKIDTKLPLYITVFVFSMGLSHLLGGISAMTSKLDMTCNNYVIFKNQGSSVLVGLKENQYRIIPISDCLLIRVIDENTKK